MIKISRLFSIVEHEKTSTAEPVRHGGKQDRDSRSMKPPQRYSLDTVVIDRLQQRPQMRRRGIEVKNRLNFHLSTLHTGMAQSIQHGAHTL